MKARIGWMALIALATVLMVSGGSSTVRAAGLVIAGTELSEAQPEGPPPIRPMTDGEIQAAACVLSATAAMTATYAAGASEVIMIVVGGLLVPSKSSVLFLSLMGTMGAASCGIGSVLAPTVLWATRQSDGLGDKVAALGSRLGSDVSRAVATLWGAPVEVASTSDGAQ